MFFVKEFGSFSQCPDIKNLIVKAEAFQGSRLTIADKRPGGIIYHLARDEMGVFRDAYGNKNVVHLAALLATPGKPILL